MDKGILLRIAASQAVGTGVLLEGLDADNKGKDDLIGAILVAVGNAATGFSKGDDGKFNAAIRLINQTTGDYLKGLQ